MAQEMIVVLAVVVPDETGENRARILDLRGRELAGVPGSWITRVAVRPLDDHAGESIDVGDASDGPDEVDADGLTAAEREHELDLDCGTAAGDD